MKRVQVRVARKIRVLQNSVSKSPSHLFIKDALTGQILHVGQPAYIKRVARKRYNSAV